MGIESWGESGWSARPPKAGCFRFTLRSLLVCVAGFTCFSFVFFGLLAPTLHEARKRSKVTDCMGNLKQLGVYLEMYATRYGSSTYPNCSPPRAIAGAAVAAGPNGAFWSHLWCPSLGAPGAAVPVARPLSTRPGENVLYFCKVYRGPGLRPITSVSLDYSGPDLTRIDLFPGGVLSDRVSLSTYIAGDLILPGDCNHGQDRNGLPNYDVNGLHFDGSVDTVSPNGGRSGDHRAYLDSTNGENGVRTS